jgi:hypothetical protein
MPEQRNEHPAAKRPLFGFRRFHRGPERIMGYRMCWCWNIILPFCVIAVGRWYTRRICVSITR